MNRLAAIVTVMLVLTALYFLVTTVFKPSQPQVIVVRPSGGQGGQTPSQNVGPSDVPTPVPPPPSVGGQCLCTKAMYLKVGETSVCADIIYGAARTTDGSLQVEFQGGIINGVFTFVSVPCAVTTTPQGVFVPCRAQILIPTKQ
jgi:hypothetical protein